MVILAPVALANENWPHFRGPTMNAAVPVDQSEQHYYRVQGPTFLIEYDNTQGDGNHIHSVWRDFTGISVATSSASTCRRQPTDGRSPSCFGVCQPVAASRVRAGVSSVSWSAIVSGGSVG